MLIEAGKKLKPLGRTESQCSSGERTLLGKFPKSSGSPWFSSGLFRHVLVLSRDELEPALKAHADLRDVLKPCGIGR